MKLIVSDKTKDLTPEIQQKFSAKLAKLSKFVERRGEREAHVTHQVERHLHKVEVIMNFYDHSLVGEGASADLDAAMTDALAKLEKQVVKNRARWRDTHRDAKTVRTSKENWVAPEPTPVKAAPAKTAKAAKAEKSNGKAVKPKIFRVNYTEDRKPMTLEEAMLEMEPKTNYFVYLDAKRGLSVLVRRADGNIDLIES